jgi:hypothetical protein
MAVLYLCTEDVDQSRQHGSYPYRPGRSCYDFFAQIVGEMHGVLHHIVKRLGRQ